MEDHKHQDLMNCGSGKTTSVRSGYNICNRQSCSTRWVPTSDQIRILRELYYNGGVRSPTAEQIQRIAARLRQFGRVEGKNVFYWFQNHKAREKQKRRLTLNNNCCYEGGEEHHRMSGINRASSFSTTKLSFMENYTPRGRYTSSNDNAGMPLMYCYFTSELYDATNIRPHEVQTLSLFPINAGLNGEDDCKKLEPSINGDHSDGVLHCQHHLNSSSLELTLQSYGTK